MQQALIMKGAGGVRSQACGLPGANTQDVIHTVMLVRFIGTLLHKQWLTCIDQDVGYTNSSAYAEWV